MKKQLVFLTHISQNLISISILVTGLFILGCSANKYSYKVKDESLALKVSENSNLIRYATMQPQNIPDLASRGEKNRGAVDVVGKVASLAIDGVILLVDKEKKKYSANYQNSVGQCYFYDQISESSAFDPTGMQFTGFTFLRMVAGKNGEVDTAVYARFVVDVVNAYEIINNSTFSLRLEELKVNYAKAKIMAKTWYQPLSWFVAPKYPALNMDFEIAFSSSFVTREGGIFENTPIGKFYLNLRKIPMDKKDPSYMQFYAHIKENPVIGRSFTVPRSFGYFYNDVAQIKPCFGQGNYSILVSVSESSRSNFVRKMLFDNSTEIIKQTGSVIQRKAVK